MHALYIVVPTLVHHGHRVPLLQRVHRGQGHGARRYTRHACPHEVRRTQLLSDHPLGALRASFRGHYGRRPARRSDAGRAVRLRARLHLARRRLLPRWRRARHDDPLGFDAARRPVARRNRAHRDQPDRRHHGVHRGDLHRRHRAGRPRHRRGQCACRERVGALHDRRDHSARHLHGLLHVRVAQGTHDGGHVGRRHRDDHLRDPG